MEVRKIDARGLSCPQPVLLVKRVLTEDWEAMEILVDSNVAKENILRLLKKSGLKFELKEREKEVVIAVVK